MPIDVVDGESSVARKKRLDCCVACPTVLLAFFSNYQHQKLSRTKHIVRARCLFECAFDFDCLFCCLTILASLGHYNSFSCCCSTVLVFVGVPLILLFVYLLLSWFVMLYRIGFGLIGFLEKGFVLLSLCFRRFLFSGSIDFGFYVVLVC